MPCKKKKKNLITARVSMLLKSRASLTCFRACFLPGQAKDLSAPPYFLVILLQLTRVILLALFQDSPPPTRKSFPFVMTGQKRLLQFLSNINEVNFSSRTPAAVCRGVRTAVERQTASQVLFTTNTIKWLSSSIKSGPVLK